jgi:hypothetical protein
LRSRHDAQAIRVCAVFEGDGRSYPSPHKGTLSSGQGTLYFDEFLFDSDAYVGS